MILSENAILRLISQKIITIEPNPEVKDSSIFMHLSSKIVKKDGAFATHTTYTLKPKEFTLALTKERIKIPKNYAAFYDGNTHLARKGIITHMGSMFVHPNVNCQITLEIFNASDNEIILEEGMRVGQLIILEVK